MKKLIAMLLAVAMVMGLGVMTAAADDVTELTLKVWAPQEDQANADSWLQQMEAKFEEAHPEYKITWINEVCGEDKAKDEVSKDPAAAADVYMFANDQLGDLLACQGIARLGGSYLEQVQNDNGAAMIDSVTGTDGNVYGFPMAANTWFCYYNKDVYTEDDVKSLETMLEKGVVAFPTMNSWYLGSFFFANGATVFGPNGNDAAAGVVFGEDNGVASLDAVLAMVSNPNYRTDDAGLGKSGLMSGEVAAYFSGSWDYDNLKEALGDKLGRTVYEADALIDQEAGMDIPAIFAQYGEGHFRALETEILSRLGKLSGAVISTGGGCVTRERNYPLLHQNGTILWLTRQLHKLPTEGRPLSQPGKLQEMFAQRQSLYRQFADAEISNDGPVEETLEAIRAVLES